MRTRRKLYNNNRSKESSRNLSVLARYLLGQARRTKTEHSARDDAETTNTRDNGDGIIRVDSETQFFPLQPMSDRISKTNINIYISKHGANEKIGGSSKLQRKNKMKYNEKTVGDKKKQQVSLPYFYSNCEKQKFMFQKKHPNNSWWGLVHQKRSIAVLGCRYCCLCEKQ